MRTEKILAVVLRVTAGVLLLALAPVFFPQAWMAAINQAAGLGELPDTAIVGYLTRSLSAMYAFHGAGALRIAGCTALSTAYYLPCRAGHGFWCLHAVARRSLGHAGGLDRVRRAGDYGLVCGDFGACDSCKRPKLALTLTLSRPTFGRRPEKGRARRFRQTFSAWRSGVHGAISFQCLPPGPKTAPARRPVRRLAQ